jgi:arylsulfatase A-like enzyme
MDHQLNRRDFLKLSGIFSLGVSLPQLFLEPSDPYQSSEADNVLIIVFDAWSAYNISLYGYDRDTTPNLSRLADRAVVYHNHYAGGNFTTPGTASLLTGTHPWKHRAFRHNSQVDESYVDKNLFHAFKNHYRLAYSHNPLVNIFLKQFAGKIDEYIHQQRFLLQNDWIINSLFNNDEDIASVSWIRAMKRQLNGSTYSLYLPQLYEKIKDARIVTYQDNFPEGLPSVLEDNYFRLEDGINWLNQNLDILPKPFLGYFHYLPPHFPYKTHAEFKNRFVNDGWKQIVKPKHLFSRQYSPERLYKSRTEYDEFILYVDREFDRLHDYLEQSGMLDNTWVVLTSDHGELFERGIRGHLTFTLHQPVIRVPLMIFEPGSKTRKDVYAPTSAIDLLPTLMQVTGQGKLDWVEGEILPPFTQGHPARDNRVYALQARRTNTGYPINEGTVMLVKDGYKMMYFFGYEELEDRGEMIELYDLENDPDELNNLSTAQKGIVDELRGEILEKISEVNEPYL